MSEKNKNERKAKSEKRKAKNLCIIPARGGSKRIPGKNIRDFFGKPVIEYAIETALQSNLFDEVMVSTEDKDIGSIAKVAGASLPFMRSIKSASDTATTVEVILEVLENYSRKKKNFTHACCLYPVTPLTTAYQLRKGWETMINKQFDAVFPIIPFSFPIWRSVKLKGDKLAWNWPKFANERSQDLPSAYHDAGQWYWFTIEALQNEKKLLTRNTGYLELSETEVQDVDEETDWQMLELKYKLQRVSK